MTDTVETVNSSAQADIMKATYEKLEARVREARTSTVFYGDPDTMVGPVAGRYVVRDAVLDLCEKIGHTSGFDDLFTLLVVEEDELLYVVGGSHRLHVVVGTVPVRRVPYRKINLEKVTWNNGENISVHKDGAAIVGAVQATESQPRPYDVIEDVIVIFDILNSFDIHMKEQLKIIRHHNIKIKGYKWDATNFLLYYEKYWQNSVEVIQNCRGNEAKKRIIRGIMKLYSVKKDVFNQLFQFCMTKKMKLTGTQLSIIAGWSPSDISNVIHKVQVEVKNEEFGHESAAGRTWKPFNKQMLAEAKQVSHKEMDEVGHGKKKKVAKVPSKQMEMVTEAKQLSTQEIVEVGHGKKRKAAEVASQLISEEIRNAGSVDATKSQRISKKRRIGTRKNEAGEKAPTEEENSAEEQWSKEGREEESKENEENEDDEGHGKEFEEEQKVKEGNTDMKDGKAIEDTAITDEEGDNKERMQVAENVLEVVEEASHSAAVPQSERHLMTLKELPGSTDKAGLAADLAKEASAEMIKRNPKLFLSLSKRPDTEAAAALVKDEMEKLLHSMDGIREDVRDYLQQTETIEGSIKDSIEVYYRELDNCNAMLSDTIEQADYWGNESNEQIATDYANRFAQISLVVHCLEQLQKKYNLQCNWNQFQGQQFKVLLDQRRYMLVQRKEVSIILPGQHRFSTYNQGSISQIRKRGEHMTSDMALELMFSVLFRQETESNESAMLPSILTGKAFQEPSEAKFETLKKSIGSSLWTKLEEASILFVPINLELHWVLAVVVALDTVRKCTMEGKPTEVLVYIFDSAPSSKKWYAGIEEGMKQLVKVLFRCDLHKTKMQHVYMDVPKQTERNSCGFHVIWHSILCCACGNDILKTPERLVDGYKQLMQVIPFDIVPTQAVNRVNLLEELVGQGLCHFIPSLLYSKFAMLSVEPNDYFPSTIEKCELRLVNVKDFVRQFNRTAKLSVMESNKLSIELNKNSRYVAVKMLEGMHMCTALLKELTDVYNNMIMEKKKK